VEWFKGLKRMMVALNSPIKACIWLVLREAMGPAKKVTSGISICLLIVPFILARQFLCPKS
jgi:Zn-dependent membrane protease YugP